MSRKHRKIILSMLLMASFIILSGSLATAITEENRVSIPSDAVVYHGHSYKVYDVSITWTEAYEACKKLGGHLATITSSGEEKFIEKQISTTGQKLMYWLGGTDAETEGVWKWITGEKWSYTKWDSSNGQPDNYNNEDYLEIYNVEVEYTTTALTWNDNTNDNEYYPGGLPYVGYICEWDTFTVTKPTELKATQPASNRVKLTWKAGRNAKGYWIYRAEGDGAFVQIGSTKKLNYTDTKVKNGKAYRYKVQSINGTNTAMTSIVRAYPMDKPKNLKAELIEFDTKVKLSWKAVKGSQEYWIYQKAPGENNFKKNTTTTDHEVTISINPSKGTYQYYVVPAVKSFKGLQSDTVDANPVAYRAVIVGQTYSSWQNPRPAGRHDRIAMNNMLQNLTGTKYKKIELINDGTKQQILDGIDTVFSLADENDVTLFFFSGHGCDSRFWFFTFDDHGALVGSDNKCIKPKELRKKMDQYKGKKVVIFSACHSGQMIGKNENGVDELAALKQINASFIRAFSSGDSRDGELATNGYYVITCCSKDELGFSSDEGSLFAMAFVEGLGWNMDSSQSISLSADTNNDSQVTLNEAYLYCRGIFNGTPINYEGEAHYMNVQVYPDNCSEVFFAR